jgi:uncharacterized protein YPO0396
MPPLNSLTVSIAVAIVLIAAIGCVVYQMMKMRAVYTEQSAEFARVTSIIRDFKQLQPGMISLLQRLDTVGKDSEAQKASLQELDKRIETQEVHLSQSDARITEIMDGLSNIVQEAGRKSQSDSSLMRKGLLSQDVELRFSMLSDWLGKNSIAILRRAAHASRKVEDLIAIIPASLQAEAEIVNDRVLLIGTRGHPDKHAIMLDSNDPNSVASPTMDMAAITERQPSPRKNGLFLSHASPMLEREKTGAL